MKYREKFGITPKQFREEIDLADFMQDLEMLNIETEIQESEQEHSQNEKNALD